MSGLLEYLEGPVAERGEDFLVLTLGGVGMKVQVPPRTAETAEPALVKLYTHLIVREDSLELYGFATREEREMFVGLLSVPQLGPKLAFRLVSALPPEEFLAAIRSGDLSALEQVKGIGRRTAQRVLVELAGRLSKLAPPVVTPLSEKEQVVIRALTSKALGFTEAEARKAVERLRRECPEASVEDMIRRALAILSGA
ncbi:TPA: Holliday junction branch migration protein RuvA [Candidatus Bipolaricaulota bacterium]|nr:Holliday junction branch migration protein RuvA [Candidatus Bipolaricaulota bacterium]